MPARYGFKAIVKHLPDQAFAIDERLYRRIGRRFEAELALWGSSDDIHMMMIATFGVSRVGVPAILVLSLMPVTQQWIPVEDCFEQQLVERLVTEGRSFVKGLRYNLSSDIALSSATLLDCESPTLLTLVLPNGNHGGRRSQSTGEASTPLWEWHTSSEGIPPLPARRRLRSAVA